MTYLTFPYLRPAQARILLWLSLGLNIIFLFVTSSPPRQNVIELTSRGESTMQRAISAKFYPPSHVLQLGRWSAQKPMQSKSCGVCNVAPELCERFGEVAMMRAMSFMGSGERMRRFLVKAREGRGFTMGVIGGSVSKGFSVDPTNTDNLNTKTNLHRIVFDHLNDLFPAPNGVVNGTSGKSEGMNGFINGALGGTGTDYFSMCFAEHIPEDVDIVTIELAINDELLLKNIGSYELMTRGLLDLPDSPALLNLEVPALAFAKIALGGELHAGVTHYYDVPSVSLRNLLLPQIAHNTTLVRQWFAHRHGVSEDNNEDMDLRHINKEGHQLAGELMNAYIDTQVCELDNFEQEHGPVQLDSQPLTPLPSALLNEGFKYDRVALPLRPQCMSSSSQKHPLEPITSENWSLRTYSGKTYLASDTPGSRVTFKTSTAHGLIQLNYLRSAVYKLGSIDCWLDGDEDKKKRIDGYWNVKYNIGQTATLGENLPPGEHEVTCELVKDTKDPEGGLEFRLISLMSV